MKCPKSADGEHTLSPKAGDKPDLIEDPLLGWGAYVKCVNCQRTGFVRLDFDLVDWDEEEG